MDKEYYILWYRLNKMDRYLIWFSDDADGVITDNSGNALSFQSKEALYEYASSSNLEITSEEPELHNLDLVSEWIKENDPSVINFSQFNNIWNLWTDTSHSTGRSFDEADESAERIYDKLFWSCTLPTGQSDNEDYIPEWTEDELKAMKELFLKGMAMFERAVTPFVK
ncbi:MAG TPA: hypothetical protein VHO03_15580 [Ignavibacteriales bacterium]|nr:hypothetical protein [Ignavibacteriales bacterium]